MWKIFLSACFAIPLAQSNGQSNVASPCLFPLNTGSGNLAILRYYFNATAGQCKEFTFGGHGGNLNQFRTLSLCERVCLKSGDSSGDTTMTSRAVPERCALKVEIGPCRAYFQRFYFDTDTGACKRFIYGGCSGNLNNFNTLGLCKKTCLKS